MLKSLLHFSQSLARFFNQHSKYQQKCNLIGYNLVASRSVTKSRFIQLKRTAPFLTKPWIMAHVISHWQNHLTKHGKKWTYHFVWNLSLFSIFLKILLFTKSRYILFFMHTQIYCLYFLSLSAKYNMSVLRNLNI